MAKYGKDEMNQIRKFDLANMDLIRQFLDSHPSFPDLVEFHTTGGIDVVPKSREETNVNEKMMRYEGREKEGVRRRESTGRSEERRRE